MRRLCPQCEELLRVTASSPEGVALASCAGCGWSGHFASGVGEPRLPQVTPKLPYVSIDIETTGLDPETCQTLEVGAVFDDWKTPLDELPRFRRILRYETVSGSPYAMALNANLLNLIANAPKTAPESQRIAVRQWTEKCAIDQDVTSAALILGQFVGAKPFAWWDIPNKLLDGIYHAGDHNTLLSLAANPPGMSCFCQPHELGRLFRYWLVLIGLDPVDLQAAGKNFAGFDKLFLNKLPRFSRAVKFRHRVLDPAILFWQQDDERLPDSKTCKERSGKDGKVSHTAIEDALDVVWAVRQGVKKLWR